MNWLQEEHASFDRVQHALASGLAGNQFLRVYELWSGQGEDIVYVSTQAEFDPDYAVTPAGYWFCGELTATAVEF